MLASVTEGTWRKGLGSFAVYFYWNAAMRLLMSEWARNQYPERAV
jgi:hypothetical protein